MVGKDRAIGQTKTKTSGKNVLIYVQASLFSKNICSVIYRPVGFSLKRYVTVHVVLARYLLQRRPQAKTSNEALRLKYTRNLVYLEEDLS